MKKSFLLAGLLIFLLFGLFWFGTDNKVTDDAVENEFLKYYRIYALPIPEDLDFAGEKVPVYREDVREKLDKELLINVYWQSSTLLKIKRANKYFPVIEPILKKYGVPEDFKYLAVAESGLEHAKSPAGARGIWQFMKSTALKYGLEVNEEVDERYDLEKSTEAACKYFLDAKEKFGSWTLAAAAYNRGMVGLSNAVEDQGVDTYYDLYLNPETARYIYRILAIKEILKQPEKYGFHFRVTDLYRFPAYKEVLVSGPVEWWPDWAKQQGITYGQLRYMNPWIRSYSLENKEGNVYKVKIPLFKGDKTNILNENLTY